MTKVKKWFPIESNPSILNKYLDTMGFPTTTYEFQDVLSTEEWALEMVPQPVAAVIFLFPIKDETEAFAKDEALKQKNSGLNKSKNVFYIKQTIGNACGTIAMLHAVGNIRHSITFPPKSYLQKFFTLCDGKTPAEIGAILEQSDELETVHESAARRGQSEQLQTVDDPINTHFICFSCVDDRLYELDGRKEDAIEHGESSPATLLQDACRVIKGFIARDPDEVRFTIMALAHRTSDE
uniref:Ubiquitin carboxyl-terminal hydrolase n=1 Tax=Albugo laibachii Nc14 TaxID=890382 RepID=F0WPE1_9STRA|nr:ubiquitin carboxylterminal hydrolase putative [Albugo laibachii Nc14]|eukprot:CCA23188.1 ubiquitin carboxylterminal hydrolase putative [Albugo laibachii Nc14]